MNDSLRVQLRPSRTLAAALVVGHLFTRVTAATGLPSAGASRVALGLGLSLFHHLRGALHGSARAVAGRALSADGRFAVADPAGAGLPAALRRSAVPATWLAVLAVRERMGRSRAAVILPDAADPEGFRGLRVGHTWRITFQADAREGANSDVPG